MISLRVREYGSIEWDTIIFDGEREEELLSILANVLTRDEWVHVQVKLEGDEWEDFE